MQTRRRSKKLNKNAKKRNCGQKKRKEKNNVLNQKFVKTRNYENKNIKNILQVAQKLT